MNDRPTHEQTYWRRLAELAGDPAALDELHRAAPEDTGMPDSDASPLTRRTFMGLLGASMALAAAGCRRPEQKIVPYVRKPEYLVPGIANHFATSFSIGTFAAGLLVRSREGRPVKIEGNELDPVSKGKSSLHAQASILNLYDPDRMLRPVVNDGDSTPQNAIARMAVYIADTVAKGKQVRVLVDEHASPSLARLYREMETVIPNCRVVTWPAIHATGAAEAHRMVLGFDGVLVPDLCCPETILGVDADFLGTDPEALFHIRNFSRKRRPSKADPAMSRFYAVESGMSITGSNADHRIVVPPHEINEFLLALLRELVVERRAGTLDGAIAADLAGMPRAAFPAVPSIATDLLKGGVVMIGRHLPAESHALGILINHVIGAYNPGAAFGSGYALPNSASNAAAVSALRRELRQGEVGLVIFGDVNPAYSMPSGAFRTLMSRVLYKFSASQYADETAQACSIFIPVNHYLETWGDAMGLTGSQSVVQPLIAPLNEDQLSLGDVFLRLMQAVAPDRAPRHDRFYDYVRARWEGEVFPEFGGASFAAFWENALRTGSVTTAIRKPAIALDGARARVFIRAARSAIPRGTLCCVLPDPSIFDGRWANNGWLMEMPDPVTKVTWDNVAVMSKKTAAAQALAQGDVIRVATAGGTVELPVLVQPGVADDVIFTTTGYGRSRGGRVLENKGKNTFLLVPESSSSVGYFAASIAKTGTTYPIVRTQEYNTLSGPDLYGYDRSSIVKHGTLQQFLARPGSLFDKDLPVEGAPGEHDRPISLYEPYDYSKGHRWGMVIDTSACVGCNVCTAACVAENNIPMVGKEQVGRGREMFWIRIDRYYAGNPEAPTTLLQPMLCQHCENAPCENVCPVAATTHSPEGLNEMTYNRCVGTRYCSNNCPYKVRRFNYLNWHTDEREPHGMVHNPDVTVRMRGIMEKCTFCVQRINEAKYRAKNEGRDFLSDGEVVTACQQACPADAITFGNTNDPASAVSKLRASERGYLVLRELNTVPSITYLASIRNTNGESA